MAKSFYRAQSDSVFALTQVEAVVAFHLRESGQIAALHFFLNETSFIRIN